MYHLQQLAYITQESQLIEQFHEAVANGEVLSPEKQQELENLVDTELEASIQRSEGMENQKNFPFME